MVRGARRLGVLVGVVLLVGCQGRVAGPVAAARQFDGSYVGPSTVTNFGGYRCNPGPQEKARVTVRDNVILYRFGMDSQRLLVDANGQFGGKVSESEVEGQITDGLMIMRNTNPGCIFEYRLRKV